jgi:tetratricopeptide (TPR) repeat protein
MDETRTVDQPRICFMTTKTLKRCLPLLAAVALLAAGGLGCSKDAKKNRHLAAAEKDFAAEKYDRAEIQYLALLRLSPLEPAAIAGLGLIYFDQGKLPQAIAYLQKAVELQPENIQSRLKLAVIHQALGQVKPAREHAHKILEHAPEQEEAVMLLADLASTPADVQELQKRLEGLSSAFKAGAAYALARGTLAARQEDYATAEAEFKQATVRDPKSERAQLALAKLYFARRDKTQAEAALRAAAELAPWRSPTRLRLAQYELQSGNVEAAKQIATEMTGKVPDYVPAWNFLAEVAFAERKPEESATLVKKVLARDPANYEALTLNGRLMLLRGEATNAVTQFERIIQTYGSNPQAQYNLALAHLQNRQEARAISSLSQAISASTNYIEAILLQAGLQLRRGEYAPVVASLNGLISRAESLSREQRVRLSQAYSLLARAYAGQRNNDAAVELYRQMVKVFPNSFEACFDAATGLGLLNRKPDALAVYQHIEQAFPTNSQAFLLVGKSLSLLNEGPRAREALEKALALSPDFIPALEAVIDLDLREGKIASARERMQRELEKNSGTAMPWLLLAKVHYFAAVDQVLKQSPTNQPSITVKFAGVPAAQEDVRQAEAALLKAIEISPDLPTSYQFLARLYVASDKQQEALNKLNAVVARTNDLGSFLQIGMIQDQLGNHTAARDAYEKVLELNPNSTEALNNLAYSYSEYLGQPERAFELADRARRLAPNNAAIADTLGWVLYKRGEYNWALSLLEESAKSLPAEPEVQFHLGITYYMLGQEESARAALERAIASPQEFRARDEARQRLAVLAIDPQSANPTVVASLEKHLSAAPNDPIALARLALILERDRAFEKAAEKYETLLGHHPKNSPAMFQLAQLYANHLNKTDRALELARAARNLAGDDARIAHLLGRLMYLKGDPKWAVSLLEESIRKLPNDPEVAFDLAWANYSLGNVAEAETRMKLAAQAGSAFPKADEARRFLSFTAAAGNPAQAGQLAAETDKVLAAQADYLPALFLSAKLQTAKGEFPKAAQTYQRILAQTPTFTPAVRDLAILTFERLGDDQAAYGLATRARESYRDDPHVARTLGILAFKRGEHSRALQLLKEAASSRGKDGELLYYLGMTHFQLKSGAESKAALQQALDLNLPAAMAEEARKTIATIK